jgi:hypothetical protein
LLWNQAFDRSVLAVEARFAPRRHRDAFDLADLGGLGVVVVVGEGCEHVAISDGPRRIRIDVVAGTMLAGPVRLRYRLEGFDGTEAKLLTLRRLLALRRLGRFARGLFPREQSAGRWILSLRAWDGHAAGASHWDIAACLFSADRSDWRKQSDFLHLRVQRLVRTGRMMTTGGYRRLLP